MKVLIKLVGTILIVVGVIGYVPNVEAMSYVWVNTDPLSDQVEDGFIVVTQDPWAPGVQVTDLTGIGEFRWVVDGVDYGKANIAHLYGTFIYIDYNEMADDRRGYIYLAIEGIVEGHYALTVHIGGYEWGLDLPGTEIIGGYGYWEVLSPTPVPEPTGLLLIATGLIGLIAVRRKVPYTRSQKM